MPRRVLALLLLSYNRTVTVSSLVDELWDSPPKLARKTVQTYIYTLRKHLDDPAAEVSRIESSPLGYKILVRPGELDHAEFEATVQRGTAALRDGDPEGALRRWREALGLWRGAMLADVHLGSLLQPIVTRAEGDRLRLQGQVIDVALGLGEYRDLVPELELLAATNPLHEGFHAQLMTALSGAGDRSRALDVFAGLRDRMVESLGLDPSTRLVELQRRVIEGTLDRGSGVHAEPPAADHPVAVTPAQVPPDTADFVGRVREHQEVTGLATRRSAGSAPRVVVLAGATGVGKTTLATHAGHTLRPEFPDGQLFAALGPAADPFDVLEHFLRAFGIPTSQIPDSLAERTSLYRSWTAGRRVLVVLDDAVHVERLAHLIPAGPGCAALVTTRVGLQGLAGARLVKVGPLAAADGVRLMRQVAGDARVVGDPGAANRLAHLCDNLPLAIRAAAEKLAARPSWQVAELVERMADGDSRLQELVTRRLDPSTSFEDAYLRLAPAYRWAFRRLCALGSTAFTLEDAAAALLTDVASAECPVAELVDANMLVVAEPTHDGHVAYRFPELVRLHALLRHEPALTAGLPDDVRQWTSLGAGWSAPASAGKVA
ncbi:BTAD domain-containing putative transcriptional regulator [Promicromonospora sp. NPDC057488]|uniref:AfsR/SARP family transcriptional regulator n=1 Tax=Promicromonospora sp. NPDC057488 TaxID=3346147 RepID=UPI0036725E71